MPRISPNPATSGRICLAGADWRLLKRVKVYDVYGRERATLTQDASICYALPGLENGTYTVRIFAMDGTVQTDRFVVVQQ